MSASPWQGEAATCCTGRVRVLKQIADLFYYLINVRERVIVPEASDTVTKAFKIFGPLLVAVQHIQVLRAVKFEDQEFFWCAEVREEWSDRKLPSKSNR
jgi:hypothetical protein